LAVEALLTQEDQILYLQPSHQTVAAIKVEAEVSDLEALATRQEILVKRELLVKVMPVAMARLAVHNQVAVAVVLVRWALLLLEQMLETAVKVFGLTLTEQQHNEAAVAAVALRGLVETEEQEVVVTVAQ
jgi:hypothetical protein